MKKLSKRQKLISFISILLVAVLIAIVITTNIIKNNNQVESEGYLATTANAGSSLIANYVLNGITIGGITGKMDVLDTSDANATPEDILWGETAYVKGEKITGTKIITIAHAKEAQKVFEENTVLLDDYGNRVKVPTGFKIAEDSATRVTEGVVVEDVSAEGVTEYTKGSQFVWVPVGNIKTDNNENETEIVLGRYNFENKLIGTLVQSAEDWSTQSETIEIIDGEDGSAYKEIANNNNSNISAKNLEEFVKKTMSSGGYYISRYEAGDAFAINSPIKDNGGISTSKNPITCKAGVYPYTCVNQSDAAQLAKNMYTSENFASDLINSYAYDTAIVFIQEFSGDSNYSIQIGKNVSNEIQKGGESVLLYVDDGDESKDIRCNICDMAGNVYEWTTEYTNKDGMPCVGRGGNAIDEISYTGGRGGVSIDYSYYARGFRVILYL